MSNFDYSNNWQNSFGCNQAVPMNPSPQMYSTTPYTPQSAASQMESQVPPYGSPLLKSTVVGCAPNGLPITQVMNERYLQNQLDIEKDYAKSKHNVDEYQAKAIINEEIRLGRENSGVWIAKNKDKKLCTVYNTANNRERYGDPICDIVDLRAMELHSYFRKKSYSVYRIYGEQLIESLIIPKEQSTAKSLADLMAKSGHPICYHRHNKQQIYELFYQFVVQECSDKKAYIPFTTGWIKCCNNGIESWEFVLPEEITMKGILGL